MKKAQMIVEVPDDVFDKVVKKKFEQEAKNIAVSAVNGAFYELVNKEAEKAVAKLIANYMAYGRLGYVVSNNVDKKVETMLAEKGIEEAIDSAVKNYDVKLKQQMSKITNDMIAKVAGRLEDGITAGIANAIKKALKEGGKE